MLKPVKRSCEHRALLVPDDLLVVDEADAQQAGKDFARKFAGVPDVSDLQIRQQLKSRGPIRAGIAGDARLSVALGAVVLHVAGFRGPAPVQSRAIPPFAVELDTVGRISNEQQRLGFAQQPRDNSRVRAIAADNAVVSKDEQIPWSRDGRPLHVRDGIRIRQARRVVLRLEQPLEFHVVEPNQVQVVILLVQNRQLDAQHFLVPGCAGNG